MSRKPLAEIDSDDDREELLLKSPLSDTDGTPSKSPPASLNILVILVTAGLILASILVGWNFWTEWFSSVDRVLCTLFVALGMFAALVQCFWGSDQPPRWAASSTLWAASVMLLGFAVASGRTKLACVAMGLAVAGWFCFRIRGESIMNAVSLGLAFMIPSFVDACKDRQLFVNAEGVALQIASGLSDAVGQSHLATDGGIRFGHGFFEQFDCEGRWDSIITYIGISCFCIYAFRRNLIAGLITLSLSFVVWMAVRGTACVAIAQIASLNGAWPEWTFTTEAILFVIGALLMFSLDNFFGVLLKPIPVEHVNPDFPLFALGWNWLVSLPNLSVEVPERLVDSNPDEEFE